MLVSVNDRALYTSPVLIMQLYTTASRSEGCLLCCRLAAVLQVGWKYSFLCISILFSSSKIAKYTKVFLRTIQNLEQS